MTMVRLMRQEDFDAIREIDAMAFGTWQQQVTGASAALPPRTHTNVLVCWEKDPEGAFVAEEDGRVIGFIFSRTWGSIGWFGTFAVLPQYQGRGIGKGLIAASLAYLRREPGREIGLETMAESPYNLGLYLRQGFQAGLPTFSLGKGLVNSHSIPIALGRWSEVDAGTRARWLADLREASGQIHSGLDYSKEMQSTLRHSLGETLVLCEGTKAVGFSNVWLTSSREGFGGELASVQVMVLHPACNDDDSLCTLLDGSEALASAHGKQKLIIPANAGHTWALGRLVRQGYQVSRVMIRMVLEGTGARPIADKWVDFSRWAG